MPHQARQAVTATVAGHAKAVVEANAKGPVPAVAAAAVVQLAPAVVLVNVMEHVCHHAIAAHVNHSIVILLQVSL